MFERSDRQNQKTLEEHNRMEKPLVSKGAIRLLTWPAYAAIAFLLVAVVVGLVVQAFQ
jgi:hypothetical protein